MVQSIMLAAMGFIAASLLGLLIAPAFWARAVRLTNQRLRGALPVTEQEIRADKDLLRAEYALKVHQLERELEQGRLSTHRQQIEINRRDIEIRRLAETLATSQSSLSEHQNARSVLEQTVTERIPVLERSLAEARELLGRRDVAIDELQSTTDRQSAALEDGRAILTQRALEVQRLQALFQEASAHGRESRSDTGGDALALRAEIESLKARLLERAAVIDRLQNEVASRPRVPFLTLLASSVPEDAAPEQLRAYISEQATEIAQLRRQIATPARVTDLSSLLPADQELAARHLQDIETQMQSQADELARLRAENEAMAQADDPVANAKVRDSKIWLRARIDRISGDLERERQINGRLRAEIAAANERTARQASQFRDEFKRQTKTMVSPAREILRDAAKPATDAVIRVVTPAEAPPVSRRSNISSRARELQRALQGQLGLSSTKQSEPGIAGDPNTPANDDSEAPVSPGDVEVADGDRAQQPDGDSGSRGRLLDRLKSYEQA